MKTIQKHPTFYVELSLEEIRICTKSSVSIYPVWLGKNRAVIRDVVSCFKREEPETLYDCLDIVGRYGLSGQGCSDKPDKNNFGKSIKTIDNEKMFW